MRTSVAFFPFSVGTSLAFDLMAFTRARTMSGDILIVVGVFGVRAARVVVGVEAVVGGGFVGVVFGGSRGWSFFPLR